MHTNADTRIAKVLRIIQKTADKQGNVTMLRLAENIANDPSLAQEVALEVLADLSSRSTDGRLRDAIAVVRSALWDEVES